MFPSSAAMLKNLQQSAMASPSFLMDNLLQSKASPGGGNDFTSLTLNWAASLVVRQRGRESRCQQQQLELDSPNRAIQLARQPDHFQRQPRSMAPTEENIYEKNSLLMDCDNGDRYSNEGGSALDRLSAMERLSERIENRSSSAVDSNNSMDEDRGSGTELDGGQESRFEFDRQQTQSHHQHEHTNIFASQQEDREAHDRLDSGNRLSEEVCSCGDEQCPGGTTCRRIQEKEKPQLKFSVNAILGGNHDRRPNQHLRVYKGKPAAKGQHSYQAYLLTNHNTWFLCGASIVNEYFALTAAHCIKGHLFPMASLLVTGTHTVGDPKGQAYLIKNVIIHPKYNTTSYVNDIGLVQTNEKIHFSSTVKPIKLAPANFNIPGFVDITIPGWGNVGENNKGRMPTDLQVFKGKIISHVICRLRFGLLERIPIHNNMMCSYGFKGQTVCGGDSGSPVMMGNVQIGVVSRSLCQSGGWQILTTVPKYAEWIRKVTSLSC